MIVFGFTWEAPVDDITRFAIDLEFVVFPVAVAVVDVIFVVVVVAVAGGRALISVWWLLWWTVVAFAGCAFVDVAPVFLSLLFCVGIKGSLSSNWLFEQFNNLDFGIIHLSNIHILFIWCVCVCVLCDCCVILN